MNKLFAYISLLIIVFSCTDQEESLRQNGRVLFSLSKKAASHGRAAGAPEPEAVMISIQTATGEWVEQHRVLPLIAFGAGYVTESLELLPGNYAVTEFLVLDGNEDVIYATPLEGSERASDVDDPLPLYFFVSEEQSTEVNLQVVAVTETSDPAAFGYANFRFEIVDSPGSPNNLTLHYTTSFNPDYVTEGLDSVVVTFSKRTEEKIFHQKLEIISPAEARGEVAYTALDLGETPYWPDWQMTVRAYYEVTDDGMDIYHINEKMSELATIPIRHETTHIRIDDNGFSLEDADGSYVSYGMEHIAESNFAHVIDGNFTFHFVANADLCNPAFSFLLSDNATYVFCEKSVYDNNGYEEIHFIEYFDTTVGQNDTVFAGMCPEAGVPQGYLYFQMTEPLSAFYLVWEDQQSPVAIGI